MSELTKFIKEARSKGYDDLQIKEILMKHSWPIEEIEKAFSSFKPKYKFKNKVCIFLDTDLLKIIEKRAKKSMFTIPEQIEDILRRSCVRTKSMKAQSEKLDDMLITLFSRKKRK